MDVYRIIFAIVACIDVVISIFSFRTKKEYGKHIAFVMMFGALTTVFYLQAISTEEYFLSSFFSSLYFICIDYMLIFLAEFASEFTKFANEKLKKIVRIVTYTVAILDTIVLIINPFFEISLSYHEEVTLNTIVYKYDPFLLYDLHLTFCYILIVITMTLLILKCIKTPRVYSRRYTSIIASVLVVVFLNVGYLVGEKYIPLDISVVFYSVAGFLVYLNVFFYSAKSMLNSTRQLLIQNLGWPIAFFDFENTLLDCNGQMLELFPDLSDKINQIDLYEFVSQKGLPYLSDTDKAFEWRYRSEEEKHTFQCEFNCMRGKDNKIIGKVIVMHDITYSKDPITGLDFTPGLYRYLEEINISHLCPVQFVTMNINGMNVINTALGREKGNNIMSRLVSLMRASFGEQTYMAKLEDGSIAAILFQMSGEDAKKYADHVKQSIAQSSIYQIRIGTEYGIAEYLEGMDPSAILQEAVDSMRNRKLMSESSVRSSLINSLTQTLLESDYETEAHVIRTRETSRKLGAALGLSDKDVGKLELLSMLHDIGKVAIPQHILLKPGRLTDEEWAIMKTHAEKGYRIAKASPELEPVAELILHHHERWDGNGYPGRLKGESIPLLSRIITVVDSYDVMVNDRPYHKAMSVEDAKKELIRCSGSQFDPEIVEMYLKILEK